MKTLGAIVMALAVASACSKSETTPPPARPEPAPAAEPVTADQGAPAQPSPEDKAAQDKAAAEAEAKQKEAERAVAALQEAEQEAAVEKQRITPAMEKKIGALVAKKYKSPKAALAAILGSAHRAPGNKDRDVYRHPLETLTFFGIRQDMTVVELGTGEGWYTELLAPLLAKKGKLVAVSFAADGPPESMRTVYGKRIQMFLEKSPAAFGKVEIVAIDPPAQLTLGAAGSADLVIAMREMHNWQRRGQIDAYLAAVHAVLKDGGTFGIEAHRASPEAEVAKSAEQGYLPEQWLIEKVESAGFKLAGKSEVNANPKDTKDHTGGVWMLPPNLRDVSEADKPRYQAIGESDRSTLKFVKVAK